MSSRRPFTVDWRVVYRFGHGGQEATGGRRAEAGHPGGARGLAAGRDLGGLVLEPHELHPRNNTLPGEMLFQLAADAIEEAGASRADPIDYVDILERYLPEVLFRGRNEHHKSHCALGAATMTRAGLQPDLLGEMQWWRTDNLWAYAPLRPRRLCPHRRRTVWPARG